MAALTVQIQETTITVRGEARDIVEYLGLLWEAGAGGACAYWNEHIGLVIEDATVVAAADGTDWAHFTAFLVEDGSYRYVPVAVEGGSAVTMVVKFK